MSWQYTPYALGSLATALVSAGLAVYVLRRLGTPGARMVALYTVAVTVWGASYAVALSSTDLAVNLFWSKVEYVGIVAVPVAWVGFAAEYAGMERWLTRRNLALLCVVPLVTLALLFTNEAHHLYWSETVMDPSGPFVALDVTYGPGCWVWISYSYALLLAGAVLVVSTLASSETLYTWQGGVLLFGVAAPWLGNAVYVFGLSPIPDLDLTPYFLLLTGAAVVWAIPQFRLFDVVPVARSSVVEGMGDGVIVLDSQNRVLDMNPAARPVAEVPVSRAIGRPLNFSVKNEEILRLADEPNGARGQVRVGGGSDRRDYEVTVSALPGHRRREEVRLLVVRDVTERVSRELLFRLLVENASDMIAIYDTSGTPRYVSPSIERVLGYEPEEALAAMASPEMIHPEDRAWVGERRKEVRSRPGEHPSIIFRVRHKNGSWRYVEGVANNLRADLDVRGVVASWRDVTERVEAEKEVRLLNESLENRIAERTVRLRAAVEELEENEERYRRLNEAAFEGLAIHEKGVVLEANDAIAAIFGYEASEYIGTNVLDHVAPESREELWRNIASDYEGKHEASGIKKDGTSVLVEIRGRPSRYLGRDVHLVAMRDVTGLRSQERALKESEAKYRAIFENAVEGIFQSTAEGQLVTANPAMARIFGYDSPEELLSSVTNVAQLYARPGRRAEFVEAMRERGAVSGFEAEVRRKDGGTAWVSAGARALRDASGGIVGYEGSMENITDRIGARRMLERRVAALTRLASNLTAGQPVESTLDAVTVGVTEETAALACSVTLLDPETDNLLLVAARNLPEGYTDALSAAWGSGGRPLVAGPLESLKPGFVRGARGMFLEEPLYSPLHPFLWEAAWEGIFVVPLVARGQALGVISAYYPPGEEPAEEERTFIGAVADQSAVAVENARYFERFLTAARGRAVLEERQRISRELHDSVSQALYGIALGSRTARTLLDRDPARAVEPLEYVLSLSEAGLAEMRALIFELRPEALEAEGLNSALEKQAAALRARHGINVRTSLGEEPALPPDTKEALYRIAQEALQNTVKHAGAANVDLGVGRANGSVTLDVSDDGSGFDPTGAFPGHLGLRSMRERAESLGGTLQIESAPGEGTRIRVRISPG